VSNPVPPEAKDIILPPLMQHYTLGVTAATEAKARAKVAALLEDVRQGPSAFGAEKAAALEVLDLYLQLVDVPAGWNVKVAITSALRMEGDKAVMAAVSVSVDGTLNPPAQHFDLNHS
jgi:hypothetical protein